MKLFAAALLVAALGLTNAWDETFRSTQCYINGLRNLEERMPQNLGNLIALIEKWERQHQYQNPENIAEALINRYKKDGIVFNPEATVHWGQNEEEETNKFDVVKKTLVLRETVPEDTYEPREECSLHFMTSHSTDIYPHAGVDEVWEDGYRVRRSEQNTNVRYSLPTDVDPAKHPIENGVMHTPYGPVAVGTLLAGIAAADKTSEVSVRNVVGDSVDEYMDPQMYNAGLHPQHISTVAGDIGQSALLTMMSTIGSNNLYMGPKGMFGNSTAAPKLFTLDDTTSSNGGTSYLTRSEVFAGIDGLLIQKALQSSSSNSIQLSQVLRMYYSEYGLPGFPEYRACNRMNAYKMIQDTTNNIQEQALHFMYAYSDHFSDIRRLIEETTFQEVEAQMTNHLGYVMGTFNSFVGSYNYEDFDSCPVYSSSDVKTENQVDLVVVYGHEGGTNEMEKQREYITHLANMLGVGQTRSSLGILDGKSADWHFEVSQLDNVADWGSNYTEDQSQSYGSGSDMEKVLTSLTEYYFSFYELMKSELSNASANAQIVLWNVPSNPGIDMEQFKLLIRTFRLSYPDVYILMVGNSNSNWNEILIDPSEDFFRNSELKQEIFAQKLATRIREIPTVFVYPACNTEANPNYREQNHVYTGYVTPNFTTYVHIAQHNFRYSGHLKLTVSSSDVKVCSSRKSMSVDSNAEDYECHEDGGDFEYRDLCGRYLEECDPIFLSVTGLPSLSSRCTDKECEFPNQIKYEIRHEGMTCGSWGAASSLVVLCFSLLTHLLR